MEMCWGICTMTICAIFTFSRIGTVLPFYRTSDVVNSGSLNSSDISSPL